MTTSEDSVWRTILHEVAAQAEREPMLASFLHAVVLKHATLEDALSFHLASKLSSDTLPAMLVREVIDEALQDDAGIREAVRADIRAARDRDPAADDLYVPLLYYKGLHALQSQRIAHWLWNRDRKSLARHLQNRISEVFGVDIHPAAKIGKPPAQAVAATASAVTASIRTMRSTLALPPCGTARITTSVPGFGRTLAS